MADNNRNWGDQRSSNQDWNESGKRYGNESNWDDRNRSWEDRSRYEGGQRSGDWNRYNQDYGQGSTYDENRYGRQSDYNRGSGNWGHGGGYGSSDYNRGSEREGSWGSSSYGDNFNRGYNPVTSRGSQIRNSDFGSTSGYGTGSGYTGAGGYGSSGGYGTGSYGSYSNRSRDEGYGSGFGFGERGDFRERNYDRGDYGSGRPYGYGSYRDRSSDYSRDYRGSSGREERNWWDKTADEVSSWFGDEDAERRRRQDRMNKGRGPKNYQRSDERIKEDINDRLSDDWFIDASEIDVTVTNGEVTLTGTVDDRSTKRRAEDIAEAVSGVKHVENRLRVGSTQSQGSGSGYATTSGATSVGTATGTTGVGATGSGGKSKGSYADVNK